MMQSMPSECSPLDVIPTSLIKSYADVFAPIIAQLANFSFMAGRFPLPRKRVQDLSQLKKPGL
jgi:hypothetical protein